MGYAFTLADVAYLRSSQGAADLAEVAARELSARTRLADIGWARTRFADLTAPLTETVLLRRRAVAKLPAAGGWLFTDDALQQATPASVAAHRARRLAGRRVHDVTCSIGAELAALVGSRRRWSAAISTPFASRWPPTTSPGRRWPAPTRCARSPAVPP